MRTPALLLLFTASLLTTRSARAADFPLKNGDVWVMAGDSITAQHLHSNYFEAFCYARYPQLKFAFRNSGVGGHTIPSTLARFDYDIEAWKPTVVSVELGMNDKGGTPTDKFLANMETMVARIQKASARPVILAASPVNDGSLTTKLTGGNQRLHEYANELKKYCDAQKIPYGDQFHALVDLWGQNKPNEHLSNSLPVLTSLSQDEKLAGVEHLRSFLAVQKASTKPLISMQGDPVHPGPPGQLMMAAALLKELGADPFVSSAVLDAAGKVVEAKGCVIENAKLNDGVLTFERLDERLPFPIPAEAAVVLPLAPAIGEMSQYTLQVKGLKPTLYSIKVNGVALPGTFSEKALDEGVNLTIAANTALGNGPVNAIAAQGRAVLGAVSSKEGLVGQWRGLSQKAHAAGAAPELKEQLADLTKKVEAADEKIREAAKPQRLSFEIRAN